MTSLLATGDPDVLAGLAVALGLPASVGMLCLCLWLALVVTRRVDPHIGLLEELRAWLGQPGRVVASQWFTDCVRCGRTLRREGGRTAHVLCPTIEPPRPEDWR